MNLYELNKLIERVSDDKELTAFYTAKREELIKEINEKAKAALKKEIEFNQGATWTTPTDRELKISLQDHKLNRLEQMKAEEKAEELNKKFPTLNAEVKVSPFGGRLEIEVSTVDKAKALNEMFSGFTFTSGAYK